MSFDAEAGGREFGQIAWALVHVEDALALLALEMVVMVMHRRLVARAVAGQLHQHDGRVVQQQLEIAVDGGHAQTFNLQAGYFQHFLRRERPSGGLDGVADGSALAG